MLQMLQSNCKQQSSKVVKMQNTNYVNAIKAINCYNDEVLDECKKWALAKCGETTDNGYKLNSSYDYLWDVLNEDFDSIGKGKKWQRTEIRNALEDWDAWNKNDAISNLVVAMLKRSVAWQRKFVK
jgi:hypothetical protein